jgi:hypothetical protein
LVKCVLAIGAALLFWAGSASAQVAPQSVANGKPCRGPATEESLACASKSCGPGPTVNVAAAADPHYCLVRGRKCAWPGSGGEDYGVQGRRENVDYYCCNPKLFGYEGAASQFWPVKCRRADGGPLPAATGAPPPPPPATLPPPPAPKPAVAAKPPAAPRAPGAPLPLTR